MGNPGVWEGEKPGWLGRDGKRMDYERTMRNQRETSYPGSKSDDANGRDRTALLTPPRDLKIHLFLNPREKLNDE